MTSFWFDFTFEKCVTPIRPFEDYDNIHYMRASGGVRRELVGLFGRLLPDEKELLQEEYDLRMAEIDVRDKQLAQKETEKAAQVAAAEAWQVAVEKAKIDDPDKVQEALDLLHQFDGECKWHDMSRAEEILNQLEELRERYQGVINIHKEASMVFLATFRGGGWR